LLRRFGTIVKWAVLLPVLLAVVLLALANDHDVTVHLNPFDADDPQLSYAIALYQLAFLIFAVGVLFGGIVAWGGARRRRRARSRREEAVPSPARPERRGEPAAQASAFLPRP
jgi:hypothetical protein